MYPPRNQSADCSRCGKPYLMADARTKYCSRKCRQCAGVAAYTARQPKEVRAQWRRYFYTERGTITALLGNAKTRASSAGLPFNLSREWLQAKLARGICELSGLPIERKPRSEGGGSRTHPFAPSLDRIIPGLGYVEPNVRLTCFVVNQARSDFGDAVLLEVARALVMNSDGSHR